MSPGWEMGFASSAPSFNISSHPTSPAYLYDLPSSDTLPIDDLLDFTNHEDFLTTDSHSLPPPNPSSSYPSDSSNIYTFPSSTTTFPDDLYIPSEEAAELEWLSRFVDDSFADVPPSSIYTPISNQQHQHNQHQHYQHQQQQQQHLLIEPCSAPGRARSKRSKANSWSMPSQSSSPSTSSSSSDLPSHAGKKDTNNYNNKGKSCATGGEASGRGGGGGGVRRCTHCASEKTPQWRTGPLGPKTLCNACGVRYKSGRLVPEYRPAASPTFVLTQHSNSHRKVLELRRQKELAAARSELLFHDYEVC